MLNRKPDFGLQSGYEFEYFRSCFSTSIEESMATWVAVERVANYGQNSGIYVLCYASFFKSRGRGHLGRVVTLSPPTSEAGFGSRHGLKWESW